MTITVATHQKLALSVPEAAAMVGLSPSSMRRLVDQGVLARVPHTDRVLIARAELERWAASTMTTTTTGAAA